VLDGEIVVLDERGRPSFERLQSRINVSRESDIDRAAAASPATFVAFDILHLDGRDLMSTDLRIRKKTLRDVLRESPTLLFADHVETDGVTLFEQARSMGVEGIVGKRAAGATLPVTVTPWPDAPTSPAAVLTSLPLASARTSSIVAAWPSTAPAAIASVTV